MRMVLLGSAAAAALAAYPLLAQEGAGPRLARIEARAAERFAMLDADKDGAVTKAEYADARAKRWAAIEQARAAARDRAFARLDTDGDGAISKREFAAAAPGRMGMADARRAPPPPPPPGAGAPPPGREGMRPDGPGGRGGPGGPGGPGMAALGDRWFDRADANHDGKVTLAEAKAAARDMAGRRMAMRDGRGPRGGPAGFGPGGDVPLPPRRP